MHHASEPILSACERLCSTLAFTILLTLIAVPAWPQKGGGGKGGGGTPSRTTPTPQTPSPRDLNPNAAPSAVILSGRVVMDQGAPLPDTVVVEQVCGTSVRARTRTDRKGNFNLALGMSTNTELIVSPESADNGRPAQERRPRIGGCELRAVLPGYASSQLPLSGSESEFGMKSVGTITLRQFGRAPAANGGAISVTSFQIPDGARKEFEKAVKAQEKNKPKDTEKHLRKAVEIYPNYATAWVALGSMMEPESAEEAKTAYKHALEADPKYVPPYLHLALMAVREQKWTEALNLTEQALRINASDYADAHFLSAIAKLNLNQLESARVSALRAAEIDRDHHQPRIQYLLAAICEARGEREMAATHLREYLQFAPGAPDAPAVRAHLSELSKNTSAARE